MDEFIVVMEDKDIEQVAVLFAEYMKRFQMVPLMTIEETRHHLLSGRGDGEVVDGRREHQVTWSYVVEVSFTKLRNMNCVC